MSEQKIYDTKNKKSVGLYKIKKKKKNTAKEWVNKMKKQLHNGRKYLQIEYLIKG